MLVPGEGATEQEWTDFNSKLIEKVPTLAYKPNLEDSKAMGDYYETMGRPKEAAGYAIPTIDGVDVSKLDHTATEAFRKVAHEAGLTGKQFERVVTDMTKNNLAAEDEGKRVLDVDISALQQEWGLAYPERVRQAMLIAEKTGAPTALVDTMKAGTLPSGTMKWLFQLSQQFTGGEGLNLATDQNHTEHRMAPAEAQQEMTRLLNDKDAFTPSNPNREANTKRLVDLQRMASPAAA